MIIFSIASIVIVFGSVLFHELAHLIMANLLGYTSKEVILYPLGGVTKIEERIKSPRDEFLISVIGPLNNFFLAGIIYGLGFVNIFNNVLILGIQIEIFLPIIANFNILIGLFNLFIPILPMDGGRVFKSLLTFIFPFPLAIKISGYLSLFFAFMLIILGFLYDPFLLFIGVIAVFSSYYLPKYSMIEHQLNSYEIGEKLTEKVPTIPITMNLHYVYEKMIQENKSNYLVIDELNQFRGLVLKDDIRRIEPIYRLTTTAGDIIRTKI